MIATMQLEMTTMTTTTTSMGTTAKAVYSISLCSLVLYPKDTGSILAAALAFTVSPEMLEALGHCVVFSAR